MSQTLRKKKLKANTPFQHPFKTIPRALQRKTHNSLCFSHFLCNQTNHKHTLNEKLTKIKGTHTQDINKIPWSLRAVKMIALVSSPTRHSAIRVWRRCCDTDRPFCNTVLELTTFTVRVWPPVPGFNWSTFVNTDFLFFVTAAFVVSVVVVVIAVSVVAVAIAQKP